MESSLPFFPLLLFGITEKSNNRGQFICNNFFRIPHAEYLGYCFLLAHFLTETSLLRKSSWHICNIQVTHTTIEYSFSTSHSIYNSCNNSTKLTLNVKLLQEMVAALLQLSLFLRPNNLFKRMYF